MSTTGRSGGAGSPGRWRHTPADASRASDAALVADPGSGDRDALGALYEQHAAAVHGLALLVCGPDQSAAVTESTFLDIGRQGRWTERDAEPFTPFLLSVALRHSLDRSRESATRANEYMADRPSADDDGFAAPPPSGLAERLIDLPELQRNAIMLAYFGRYTYEDVAAMLHEPRRVVAKGIRDGLAALRTPAVGGASRSGIRSLSQD